MIFKKNEKKNTDNKIFELQIQQEKLKKNLASIENRIVIFSGKGGVGKTSVAVNLAYALVGMGKRVGLLDADVTGPNVPGMVGLHESPAGDETGIFPLEKAGLKIISIGFMIDADQPVVWRGPLRSNVLRQFLADVRWGNLDFLLADLPPGTGDEVLTMAQNMEPTMAIIVTTPQEIALTDTRRAANMAVEMKISQIGIVENMSGFTCPKCGAYFDIFDSGGGEKEADELGVSFLGRLPIDMEMRKGADIGLPIVLQKLHSKSSNAFKDIAEEICKILERG